MKNLALLISVLFIIYSCANRKNTQGKTMADSSQINKKIPINKSKFAPGTLALTIKISAIIPHDNYDEIIATISKTLGSGAGITGVYSEGKEVSFKSKRDLKLEVNSTHSFLFKETQIMGNNKSNLNVIKESE